MITDFGVVVAIKESIDERLTILRSLRFSKVFSRS